MENQKILTPLTQTSNIKIILVKCARWWLVVGGDCCCMKRRPLQFVGEYSHIWLYMKQKLHPDLVNYEIRLRLIVEVLTYMYVNFNIKKFIA